MQISIKGANFSSEFTLEVESSDTVESVELKIMEKIHCTRDDRLIFSGRQISGRIDYNVDVGQSIPSIHLPLKFLMYSDQVVVNDSSRSEGRDRQVNMYVTAFHKYPMTYPRLGTNLSFSSTTKSSSPATDALPQRAQRQHWLMMTKRPVSGVSGLSSTGVYSSLPTSPCIPTKRS